jgi:hypothetical protein
LKPVRHFGDIYLVFWGDVWIFVAVRGFFFTPYGFFVTPFGVWVLGLRVFWCEFFCVFDFADFYSLHSVFATSFPIADIAHFFIKSMGAG